MITSFQVINPARAGLISTVTGPAHTVTNTWESEREVLDVKTNTPLTAGVASAYDYAVNPIGQRSSVAASGSAFTAAAGWAWGYDALGQVTSATHTADTAKNQGYMYDDIGNRKQATLGDQPVSTTAYTPNLLNQYSAITGSNAPAAAPTYDSDGNQLSGASGPAQGQTFIWDAENRLTAVKDASGTVLVSYVYDSKSRRVRRTEGTQTTLYVYHGWNCIAEFILQNSSLILSKSYAWGLDLSGSVQGAGGVGGLLSVTHNSQSGAPTYFPTYDGNGNISEYLTASGAVSAHFEYDAFGQVITSTGNTSDFDYRFSTKPQDTVTGWSYYGYRWYDSVSGRWASRDPIEEDGGVNLFGFLYNNTQNKIDILGLILECLNEEAKTDVEKVRNGSETGKKNVEQLEKSKNKHTVDTTSGGGSSNKPHDKKGLDDRKNGTGTGTHTRYDPAGVNGFSGESVLAHELQHAADSDNGTIDFGDKNKNGYPDAEDKAVDAENDHRKSGEDPDLRDDYGDQNPDPNKRDPEPEKKPTQGSGGQCPCKK